MLISAFLEIDFKFLFKLKLGYFGVCLVSHPTVCKCNTTLLVYPFNHKKLVRTDGAMSRRSKQNVSFMSVCNLSIITLSFEETVRRITPIVPHSFVFCGIHKTMMHSTNNSSERIIEVIKEL